MKFRLSSYLIFLLILFKSFAFGQISPGDLSNSHSKFEGLSNCNKCHDLGSDDSTPNFKCLDCHKEIRDFQKSGAGYHSSNLIKNKKCFECHNEHHGRNFNLIKFDTKTLNHSLTGFKLEGAHSRIKCSDCHQPKNIKEEKYKKKKNTFFGLTSNCLSCHTDFHKSSVKRNCIDCHSFESFKANINFNHSSTKFSLTGEHQKLSCDKCHKKETINNITTQKLSVLPFNDCDNCHKSPHSEKLGKECKGCHISFNSFKEINKVNFDHNKTKFQLLGKHSSVKCESCHKEDGVKKINFQYCSDCHTNYHKNEITIEKEKKDCSACHNVNGFKETSFSITDHNKLNFKLDGSHLAIPCQSCHLKNNKWVFKLNSSLCSNCHNNIHNNTISSQFLSKRCVLCHNTNGWQDISFDHSTTKFILKGKHSKVTCSQCHIKKENGKIVSQEFANLKANCTNCHSDIHNGQFTGNDNPKQCTDCHEFDDWRPVKFDHNNTSFQLAGAHSKVECDKCHKTIITNNVKVKQFKLGKTKCILCHQ